MTDDGGYDEDDLIIEVVNRLEALETLLDGPLTRDELEDELDSSSTTVHRMINSFTEKGLIEENDNGFVVTGFGKSLYSEVSESREVIRKADQLEPLLEDISSAGFDPDNTFPRSFNLTLSDVRDPYRPVDRQIELIKKADELRGIFRISAPPEYINRIYDEIMGGTDTEIIVEPSVLKATEENYPEKIEKATESERLSVRTHGNLPFGLVLFDDEKAGLSSYDSDTGILKIFVDTDDPEAVEWIESIYESYRSESEVP